MKSSKNDDNNNTVVSKKDVIAKDAIDENNETESDDGLMNVNVKERRQNLMEMLNSPVNLKTQANVSFKHTVWKDKNFSVLRLYVKSISMFFQFNGSSMSNIDPKATMSRIAAKNAAIVKMAVQNLDNKMTMLSGSKNAIAENDANLETASLIAIEAASKVKMMVSKFDNSHADEVIQKV